MINDLQCLYDSKPKHVFVVFYHCPNCGHEFNESYTKNTEVKIENLRGIYHEVAAINSHEKEIYRRVDCPNCGYRSIEMVSRNPVECEKA
jgi:DNA-directed RNA polymerase subunit RPC12/RpoP